MPLENNSQLEQIKEMNASEMAKQLSIDSYDKRTWVGITNDIQSGKYNTVRDKDPKYYKCNIFLDDMLKKYYGISLPRRGDFENPVFRKTTASGNYEGWEENPASAALLNEFFKSANNIEGTGITEVDPIEGSKLAAKGKPVVVLGNGHATLAAPHQRWPLVYRSDQSRRGSDTRLAVGLKKDSGFNFYIIEPEKYKKFKEILTKFKSDDVMNPFSKSGKRLRQVIKGD